jgi:hypothetical protein
MYSASGASVCTFCTAGMYAFEARQCIACPAGKYGETGCKAGSNGFVRLVACTSEACRLEVLNPNSNEWGTVCSYATEVLGLAFKLLLFLAICTCTR